MNEAFYQNLFAVLNEGDILHTTGNGIDFTFHEWRADGALVFLIPSKGGEKTSNKKSIPKNVLLGLDIPTFTDCRRTILNKLVLDYAL